MRFIHFFGVGQSCSSFDPGILGNKGANLAKLSKLGINLPPGFILSSSLCRFYYENNKTLPASFDKQLQEAISALEKTSHKQFGSSDNPLLLSVRSGAKVSMPGIMETILNVGINKEICSGIASRFNENFALDTYSRFLQMYGKTVLKISTKIFEQYADHLDKTNLKQTVNTLLKIINLHSATKDLEDTFLQLKKSIIGVLDSWSFDKAVNYRNLYNISEDHGTAVIVQQMVFGNINSSSGTGVVFSRNPSNGSKGMYGEFLPNAQGEDIVSGSHNAFAINDKTNPHSMINAMPKVYQELETIAQQLETFFKDVQDIEFTVEDGKLYILQTRNAKRTTLAAIKIAVDQTQEGLITKQEALLRVQPETLSNLMHPSIDYEQKPNIIGSGLPASPGAASGRIAFEAQEAEEMSKKGHVILVRLETSPEDIRGMHFASGILTSKGGYTSHAAVIARGIGKPCVSGANIEIDIVKRIIKVGDTFIDANSQITIDGSTGNIILGKVALSLQHSSKELDQFILWIDEFRKLKVRANAENKTDILHAIKFGAEGIGLARTEHMLFEPERLKLIRKIILEGDFEKKSKYVRDLFKLHKQDFKEIFALLGSMDVNIRLFDPPLHEFISLEDAEKIAATLEMDYELIVTKIKSTSEQNPMLGNRGVRLGITYPELYEMQVEAIFEAAIELKKSKNINVNLEIMIPFIASSKEVIIISKLIHKIAHNLQETYNEKIQYKLGVMIELPRAALIAERIAKHVDYFSFGTNDLTQTVYGISRDDFDSFSLTYKQLGIFTNPFISLDQDGVGQLISIACKKGRSVKPSLSLSVCGEHAADPKSIGFFNNLDLSYISCSPFRILIAKLAAAQSAIKYE